MLCSDNRYVPLHNAQVQKGNCKRGKTPNLHSPGISTYFSLYKFIRIAHKTVAASSVVVSYVSRVLKELFMVNSKCQKLVFADISFYGHV